MKLKLLRGMDGKKGSIRFVLFLFFFPFLLPFFFSFSFWFLGGDQIAANPVEEVLFLLRTIGF